MKKIALLGIICVALGVGVLFCLPDSDGARIDVPTGIDAVLAKRPDMKLIIN